MVNYVNVQDAKTRLSALLSRVEAGEEIIIARSGKPIARLTGLAEPPLRKLGFVPGLTVPDSFFEPLPDEEMSAWERR